ncbi:hypothetical protein F441_10907 [Phytophthora nicotianae CJ01A1]|nr:hypothetical protein PPTG_13008 [Phytophthora nicotianae INRA-310]ETK84315.1 hypothetical protein L915_10709 [Phytophthora nicotianae]ETO72958.1 hypothetical protein F444_11057 [Phytophthora nicotianae P1976]ETP14123.1 hypothetical protein F441_10907 [Phytophthora nicotianae CJ01A1]KUF78067.1 hypothetical protein AM587_10008778 [Phytophthora nicotianae]ETL37754.1 hypothetical protein L916_10601 [Phytophthora nicotianae]
MGSPSACDECGKKFKVFGLKKKCKHCMDVVCKGCLAAHLELKHTHLNAPPRGLRRRKSLEIFDATGNDDQELQFLSPIGSPDLELEYADPESPDVLDGVEGVDAVSDEEDDGDFLDYDAEDDAEDDELIMTTLARQSSIEEEEIQHREMNKIQGAVATWAIKEKQAKMDMRVSKKESYCSMAPVFQEVCDYENCSVFAVSYAVMATVVVWAVFGLLLALYLRARSLPVGFSYVL